jgi:hypothetical protein
MHVFCWSYRYFIYLQSVLCQIWLNIFSHFHWICLWTCILLFLIHIATQLFDCIRHPDLIISTLSQYNTTTANYELQIELKHGQHRWRICLVWCVHVTWSLYKEHVMNRIKTELKFVSSISWWKFVAYRILDTSPPRSLFRPPIHCRHIPGPGCRYACSGGIESILTTGGETRHHPG